MNNNSLKVEYLNKITKELLKKAILLTLEIGTTRRAPLGSSGDTIILYDKISEWDVSRCSQISVRKYNGDVELLITNKKGAFLFHGSYQLHLGIDFITSEYYRIFKKIGGVRILTDFRTPAYEIKVKPIN